MNVFREKIQRMLQRRSFYIVFSIIASIALWTYVAYVENPDVPVTVGGIPVEFVNESALTDESLILTGTDRSAVSLQFTGKRNTVSHLSNSNIKLTVDLSDILKLGGMPGGYQLTYDIAYPAGVSASNVSVTDSSAGYITVTVENLISAEIPVRGSYDGGVVAGYRADPMEFSPETITVSGPEALVNSVDHAWVTVQRENISATVEAESGVILMDSAGNVVAQDKLTLSDTVVKVKIPVVIVKDVALSVNFVYGASATEDNVIYTISPPSITLSGDAEILDDINKLTLGTIDLTSFSATTTEVFPVVLPNSVENVSGVTTALVTVQIRGVDTAKVVTTDIQVKNGTERPNVQIITQSVEVTLRGTGASADLVMPENVRVVADLSELGNTEGTFSVPTKVYVDGTTTVDVIGEYPITVTISAG